MLLNKTKDAILFLRIKWRYDGVRACGLEGDLMAEVQLLLLQSSAAYQRESGAIMWGEESSIAANQINESRNLVAVGNLSTFTRPRL